MNKKEVIKYNDKDFLIDLKLASEVMVFSKVTRSYFKIRKQEVLRLAETQQIHYYLTDQIFKVRRTTMVIL